MAFVATLEDYTVEVKHCRDSSDEIIKVESLPKLEDKWPSDCFETVHSEDNERKLGMLMIQKQTFEEMETKDESVLTKIAQLNTLIECLKSRDDDFKSAVVLKNIVPSKISLHKELANVKKTVVNIRKVHKQALSILTEKKQYLRDRLRALNLTIDDVYYELHKRIQHNDMDFVEKIRRLDDIRDQIQANKGYTGDELKRMFKPIEKDMGKIRYDHSMIIMTLNCQKHVLDKESKVLAGEIDEYLAEDRNPPSNKCPSLSGSSEYSEEATVAKVDTAYLQSTVGLALSLGLAEIIARRPEDPIHYLSHWLFTFRYNKDTMEVKKRELDDLLLERERLQDELRKRNVEIDAYDGVIELVQKIESEVVLRNVLPDSKTDFVTEAEAEEGTSTTTVEPDEEP